MTRCGRVLRQRVCEFIRRKNSLRWASRTTKTDRKNAVMHIKEGKRNIAHYNLDIIIAICYRVQSDVAVRFRHWATQRLHEYIQKALPWTTSGFAGAPTDAGLSTVILFFVYPNRGIFYWNFCKNLVISLFSMISASVKMCLVLVVVLCGHIVSVCK